MSTALTTSREALLAQADSLLRKSPFTKEDSSKVENLLRLADAVQGDGLEVRKLRMALRDAQMGVRTPDSERFLGIDAEFNDYIRGGKQVVPIERRAQSITADASGGYLVPQPFRAVLEESLKAYDQIFDVATRIESKTGNATNVPLADDTSQAATIVNENDTSNTGVDVVLAALAFGKTPTWRTGLVRGSREWFTDSAVDVTSGLADLFAKRIARGVGQSFVSTLLSSATSALTAASSTAVTGDEILTLMGSLDPAFSQRGVFAMNANTLTSIWKLKASTAGSYLIPASVDAQGYPTIFAKRVYLSPSMPSMTTGQKAIAFGDLSRFIRRDVANSMALRTYEERYAEYYELAWEMFLRTDGGLLIPPPSGSPAFALSPVRYITMA